uniref:EF-hand domain-containing protein n=1 Tax=Oryza barthii TaxID=65489 RepID=A0A0D3FG97_9ORYZ
MERTRSWFGRRRRRKARGEGGGGGGEEGEGEKVVVDGSEIRELVEDREAFGMFAESKFRELDADGDGRLSVRELQPAVEGIGAALGLPARGSSPNADHIYSEAISELTHGKKEEVSRTEFQEVLSDILLGMAAGLKRDPIVILRIDGEDLRDFVDSPRYEPEAAAIFSKIGSEDMSLRQCLLAALQLLNVDNGMPPASDPWVAENIIEPALQKLPAGQLEQPASQDVFLEQLKKLLSNIAERLQEQPVIVAHTENTFDGSGVKRLLDNKFELDKLLDSVWKDVLIEHKNKGSRECLIAALDKMADAAGLPPYGAVNQVDAVVNEALKTVNADERTAVDEAGFKKLLTDILRAVMMQLNRQPIFVSNSTVVHEPLFSSSAILSSPPVKSSPMVYL